MENRFNWNLAAQRVFLINITIVSGIEAFRDSCDGVFIP